MEMNNYLYQLVTGEHIDNSTAVLFGTHLRVERRRLEAELVNIGEKRPIQLLAGWWDVQTDLPLLFCYDFCIAWRGCRGRKQNERVSIHWVNIHNRKLVPEIRPTFRPLRQTHPQPAHAALAADAGGTGAKGVERDGSDDQRQVQGQVDRPRYVHIHLGKDKRRPEQTC